MLLLLSNQSLFFTSSVSGFTGFHTNKGCHYDYFIKQQESCQYLGSPSHMTQDGDQLASYSFSLNVLGGSSAACVASSTTWTSSALRATVGDAALAFSTATASLWLKLVKSMPLILNNTSPVQRMRQKKNALSYQVIIFLQILLLVNESTKASFNVSDEIR